MKVLLADAIHPSTVKILTELGHDCVLEPNRFRWELGTPAETIAVRNATEMLVIYPRLKRAERFPLEQQSAPSHVVLQQGHAAVAAGVPGLYWTLMRPCSSACTDFSRSGGSGYVPSSDHSGSCGPDVGGDEL